MGILTIIGVLAIILAIVLVWKNKDESTGTIVMIIITIAVIYFIIYILVVQYALNSYIDFVKSMQNS